MHPSNGESEILHQWLQTRFTHQYAVIFLPQDNNAPTMPLTTPPFRTNTPMGAHVDAGDYICSLTSAVAGKKEKKQLRTSKTSKDICAALHTRIRIRPQCLCVKLDLCLKLWTNIEKSRIAYEWTEKQTYYFFKENKIKYIKVSLLQNWNEDHERLLGNNNYQSDLFVFKMSNYCCISCVLGQVVSKGT